MDTLFRLGHHRKNLHGLLEIGLGFHLCETLIKNSNIHEPTKQRPTKQTHSNGYIIITIFNFSPEKKIHRLTLAHTTSTNKNQKL